MNNAKKRVGSDSTLLVERTLPSKAAAPEPGKRARAVEGPVARGAAKLPSKTDEPPSPARGKTARHKAPLDPRVLQDARKLAQQPEKPDFGEQIPRAPGRSTADTGAGAPPEQYVRIRVHVAGDRLRVTDSHLVDGPLAQPLSFAGACVYEFSIDDRLLYAASLPDIGVQRSFVDPSNDPQRQGHFITERQAYDFHARIPAHELTRKTIAAMRLTLHRIKEPLNAECLDGRRLTAQFEKRLRPIAELAGLPTSVLPAAIERRGARTPSA
jgi:hypothetical protein